MNLRLSLLEFPRGPLTLRDESPRLLCPLPALDDDVRREGRNDDEEHQGAEAESPAGTVVPHDGDLYAVSAEARISWSGSQHGRRTASRPQDSGEGIVRPVLLFRFAL